MEIKDYVYWNDYDKEVAEAIFNMLTKEGLKVEFNRPKAVLSFDLNIAEDELHHSFIVREGYFFLYVKSSTLIVDLNNIRMMNRVPQLINRINCYLENGNFELDCETGELRMKFTHFCEEEKVPARLYSLLFNMINTSGQAFSDYWHALEGVILRKDMTAREAIEDIERVEKFKIRKEIAKALAGDE